MGLETKFDEVFAEYDKWRPGYVPQLYGDIFEYKEISRSGSVLEIGIGTGQATLPFLEKGCSLTAVEPGGNLAEFTRRKFSKYKNFKILNAAFEDLEFPGGSFDMAYSASAFHWIPEEIGYTKIFGLLKNGGVFARFANHPYKDKSNGQLDAAIQKIYSRYMPSSPRPPEYDERQCKKTADTAGKYGFTDIAYRLYKRTRTFDSAEYTCLLGTYSDHIALEEKKRAEFFREIENTICRFGGKITVYDTISLQLARKP